MVPESLTSRVVIIADVEDTVKIPKVDISQERSHARLLAWAPVCRHYYKGFIGQDRIKSHGGDGETGGFFDSVAFWPSNNTLSQKCFESCIALAPEQ
jgi:hypothetical protein